MPVARRWISVRSISLYGCSVLALAAWGSLAFGASRPSGSGRLQEIPPVPASAPAPPVPSADVVWKNVIAAYRSGPIAERVRVGVLTPRPTRAGDPVNPIDPDRVALEDLLRQSGPDADERRGVIFFRSAPNAAGQRIVRLEMGDLRVFAEPGLVVAIRQSVPGGVVVRTIDGPVTVANLGELMPPLPLPQLELALSEGEADTPLMPGLPAVEWETAQRVRDGTQPRLVLRGKSRSARGDHRVEVAVDESTFRLTRVKVTAPPRPAAEADVPIVGDVVLELFITAVEPGEVAGWRIGTDGRIAVESLDKLRSAPPAATTESTTVRVGEKLPLLHLCNARTEAWATDKSPAGKFAGVVAEEASRFRVALLVFTPAKDAAGRQQLAVARAALELAAAKAGSAGVAGGPGPAVATAGVALVGLNDFDASLRSVLGDWTTRGATQKQADVPLLCSPAGATMLARLADPPGPVIVCVDESMTIRELVAVPRDGDAEALADRIAEAIGPGS